MEYTLFFPQFSNFVISVLAFVLCLSIIVFVHEFGHYFIGKLSGIHAEVFSIGFGPVIISAYDKRGTKWQIAAFPLGGYVKFLGDKNAASSPDLETSSDSDTQYIRSTMHGAPLLARFLTVAAGPIFNFIFSGIIFFLININQGTVKFPLTVQKLFDAPFQHMLKEGDVVKSINGVQIENEPNEIGIVLNSNSNSYRATYVVKRDGRLVKLENVVQNPPRIDRVFPKSAAMSAGLKKGDLILSLNSEKITSFNQIKTAVERSKGKAFKVEYWRSGEVLETLIKPLIVDVPVESGGFERIYRIGIASSPLPFEPATQNQSFFAALFNSIDNIYSVIKNSFSGLYHILFGKISTCNLSGPISMGEISGHMIKQGGIDYLWTIAAFSTAIGLINLFPIPVLDGGHLMFFTVEAVIGKKPNQNIVNNFMIVGFILLVGLMVFALSNDILCRP